MPEEIELMSIFSETEAEKDALQFNKQERALLVKRFIPIFKTATISVSPTNALYVTLGTIMFPRVLIMLSSYQRIGERNARNLTPKHNNNNDYDDHTDEHQ